MLITQSDGDAARSPPRRPAVTTGRDASPDLSLAQWDAVSAVRQMTCVADV